MAKISSHFSESEVKCKCGCGRMVVNPILVRILEAIRSMAGNKPITVHSWNRCEKWNKKVGGAADSQHLYGAAADISIKGLTPKLVGFYAEKCGADGVGIYDTFCHVDVRGWKTKWDSRTQGVPLQPE